MDVCGLFIGDTTMSYGSLRSNLYRDYEKFPYGTFENNRNPTIKDYYSKVQEKCQQMREQQKKSKQSCPFCRENKKRPLVNYMRKRQIHKHKDSICEEDEEEQQQQQQEVEENEEHDQHHHDEDHATHKSEDSPASAGKESELKTRNHHDHHHHHHSKSAK